MTNPESNPPAETQICKLIDELRADEGSAVTFLCENPDAAPGYGSQAIYCCGEWTNWKERRFEGDTVLDCLRAAISAMKYFEAKR